MTKSKDTMRGALSRLVRIITAARNCPDCLGLTALCYKHFATFYNALEHAEKILEKDRKKKKR